MKRSNGTGSVTKLSGNRRRPYAVRVSYQERPGLWKQRYLSYHRTAKEAQEALERYSEGRLPTHELATTWGDVYNQWSARKYAKAGASSIQSYKASWSRLSTLENKEMFRITIEDMQSIIDNDEVSGLSKSSINNDLSLMRALFKHAMERDIISKDYSAFVELPKVGAKREKGIFSEAQIGKLKLLASQGFAWADTVLMLCYTGFRIAEFLSLTSDNYHPGKTPYLQGGMKTTAGINRIVPVHPIIMPYLERRLERQGKTIICSERGKPISPDWYRKTAFLLVATELDLPQSTPHWCRHTAASRMKQAGMDELAIRRILGHANKDITEHYTHTDIDFLSQEMQKLK